MLFKEGVEPKWEDPQNVEGGSLIVELDNLTEEELNEVWKNMLFSLIGNSFEYAD